MNQCWDVRIQSDSLKCTIDLKDNGINMTEINRGVVDEWDGLIKVWLTNQTLSAMKLRR